MRIAWSGRFVAALFYLAALGSALAFGAYFALLRQVGPARAAYVGVMSTIVALLVSATLEGYDWTRRHGDRHRACGRRQRPGPAPVRKIPRMKVNGIPYRSLWPTADGAVEIIDQRGLPYAFATRALRSVDDVIDAIRTMAVRGAPLIGVAGAYGLALAMRRDAGDAHLADAHRRLNASRPTAVNLRWALDRMRAVLAPLPPAQRRGRGLARGGADRRRGRRTEPRDRRARRPPDRARFTRARAGRCRC